ncbi:hypothetical protein [Micromonospora okii]|uniref:hypothetical protein n=1 Tax=Micromonospora okii TaxID=1182970 RepID=UPI001E6332CE|nr:hypothetical protein [Micromonospora okii]
MQSVAFARPARSGTPRLPRPSWQATLRRFRELGRLALTALVLAVGLGGVSAVTTTPASAADLARPAVVTSRVDALRPGSGPAVEPHSAPAARPTPDDARHPAPAPAAAGAAAVPVDHPAVDPIGGTVVRRGPPRH